MKALGMTTIDKYILKETKMPIIFGVSLFTFIFLIEIVVTLMESIIVKGISLFDIIRMLSFYLPPIMAQTIPMGVFLGVMITFSKFTRNSESVAMLASGMNIRRIIKPIFMLTVVITLFIFFLQESIIPRSFEKLQYFSQRIAYENPVFQLSDRIFIDNMEDYYLYINEIEPRTGVASGVLAFQRENDLPFPSVLVGKNAHWEDSNIVIGDSKFYKFDANGIPDLTGEFVSKKVPMSAYFKGIKIRLNNIETMSVRDLSKELATKTGSESLQYMVEINRKLALPLSTLMLGILGVCMSLGHHRSGKNTSFAMSIFLVFFYIMLLNIGMVMGTRGKIHPIPAVWLPNVLLLLFTVYVYLKKSK